jgi:uncharacterized repeat protein (TIGR03803 family)
VLWAFLSFLIFTSAQQGQLWGLTGYAGPAGNGTIFSLDSNGNNFTNQYIFPQDDKASYPKYTQLCPVVNGRLYGVTSSGGTNDAGVLFSYNCSTNTFTELLDFDYAVNGGWPNGSLVQANNSLLYGMTEIGGANNKGVLFSYNDSTDTFTKLLDFNDTINGANPDGSLMQADDSLLYGMTTQGGVNNDGVLFSYNPFTNSYQKLLDFNGTVNGANPTGSLIQATNGLLFGMTTAGGGNNEGVLFSYNPTTSAYSKLLDFNGANGANPFGSLLQAGNGLLYGMTERGGVEANGVLFSYNPLSNIYTQLYDFADTINGSLPLGSPIQSANGLLYGTTNSGGANNDGVVFSFNPTTNAYIDLFDFNNANGASPCGSLTQADNGLLYGMTESGGLVGNGVLFSFNPATNNYTTSIYFNNAQGGAQPTGIIQADNGLLYGVTVVGGANAEGTIFSYDPVTSIYAK